MKRADQERATPDSSMVGRMEPPFPSVQQRTLKAPRFQTLPLPARETAVTR